MKVLLVMNKAHREMPIMEAVKREVLLFSPASVVEIKQMYASGFNPFVFKFRPDVILTFPFTGEGLSRWYYLFKVFLRSRILTLRTEGVVDFSNEYNVQWATGFDQYGSNLVDCELFWGHKLAREVGSHLLKQNKIESLERIRVVGYPRLESYFTQHALIQNKLPERVTKQIGVYDKQNIFMLITGFHLANYTKQDLFDAGDLNASDSLGELLEGVEISKRFRSEWIENLIRAAEDNPSALFVIKKHPIEKEADYVELNGVRNILFIWEDTQIDQIIPFVSVFFHYGSTALVDAYLSNIPAIYVYSKLNKQWYPDLGWPSNKRIEVHELAATVKDCISNKLTFEMTADIKRVLKEMFNIDAGKEYRPSRDIAAIILDGSVPQKVLVTDKYFLKAAGYILYEKTIARGINLVVKVKQKIVSVLS